MAIFNSYVSSPEGIHVIPIFCQDIPSKNLCPPEVRAAEQAQKKMQRLMQKEAEARQIS